MHIFALPIAEIAQLVEHDLAKVGVASSSLVFRSSLSLTPVGLFSYISVGYAALARLYGCSGRVCDFSESGWILAFTPIFTPVHICRGSLSAVL